MLRAPNNPNTSILQENLEKSRHAEVLRQFSRLEVSSDSDLRVDNVVDYLDTPTPYRKSIFEPILTSLSVEPTRQPSRLKSPSCRAKFPQSHSPMKSILIAGRFGDLSPSKRRVKFHRVEKRRKKVDDLVLMGLMESIKLD